MGIRGASAISGPPGGDERLPVDIAPPGRARFQGSGRANLAHDFHVQLWVGILVAQMTSSDSRRNYLYG